MKKNITAIISATLLGLFVGGTGTYLIMNYYKVEKKDSAPLNLVNTRNNPRVIKDDFNNFFNNTFDDDFFGPNYSPFKQMEKMRKNMNQLFENRLRFSNQNTIFDKWFDHRFGGSILDIKQDEDEKYVYYKIFLEGVDKNKLKINVKNRMLNISGEISKITKKSSNNSYTQGNFRQKFHRSFPVPVNVNTQKVQFETKENIIVVKFPKNTNLSI